MQLLGVSFVAGLLTVLAPCVLPLLPVILGGSLLDRRDRLRPYVIVGSLAISIFVFTLILKATTALLNVPVWVWTVLSGGILILVGVATVWPGLYERAAAVSGFYNVSQRLLGRSAKHGGWTQPVLVGAALGPVFASCSPTYALIIATVLPTSLARGVLYLLAYVAGLTVFLLAVVLVGRRLTAKLGWALNPEGWFKRVLGIILITIGLAVVTGFDKKVENYLIDHQIFDETRVEQNLLPGHSTKTTTDISGAKFALSEPVPAPELQGITNWINSSGETIAGLRGKVVMIDFWTYSCINCIHTLPHVEAWYEKYQKQGLVVLGIHAPEFAFEHVPANVAQAVKDDHLTYPVGLDNDMATWNAFHNQYWPAKYFIDRTGQIRHYTFGEGEYENDERVIRALLAEGGQTVGGKVEAEAGTSPNPAQTPETYLGYERAANNANNGLKHDEDYAYALPASLASNAWGLGGTWKVGGMDTRSSEGSRLRLRFAAKQVYLVMGSDAPARVKVLVNGQVVTAIGVSGADVGPDGFAAVGGSRLYRLVKSDKMLEGATLELQFPAGVTINAFTFDS